MARSSLATDPVRLTNRAPDMPTAASEFHPPRLVATSSCQRGSKSSVHPNSLGKAAASPHSDTSSLAPSSSPSGTTSSKRFGNEANNAFTFDSMASNSSSTFPASSPALDAVSFKPLISSVSSPLLSLINMPTFPEHSLRILSASSRFLMSATRSALRAEIVLAASIVASEARREVKWERTMSRLSATVRASRLEGREARERRSLIRAGAAAVSASASALAVEKRAEEWSSGVPRRAVAGAEKADAKRTMPPTLPLRAEIIAAAADNMMAPVVVVLALDFEVCWRIF
mmetsp:Transcript_8551/g.18496  ORF Transcript_8551/g.18496 Transcript_8551/m.18496 type:complete len:287 (+) Transcript_8551:332-1192(+)